MVCLEPTLKQYHKDGRPISNEYSCHTLNGYECWMSAHGRPMSCMRWIFQKVPTERVRDQMWTLHNAEKITHNSTSRRSPDVFTVPKDIYKPACCSMHPHKYMFIIKDRQRLTDPVRKVTEICAFIGMVFLLPDIPQVHSATMCAPSKVFYIKNYWSSFPRRVQVRRSKDSSVQGYDVWSQRVLFSVAAICFIEIMEFMRIDADLNHLTVHLPNLWWPCYFTYQQWCESILFDAKTRERPDAMLAQSASV